MSKQHILNFLIILIIVVYGCSYKKQQGYDYDNNIIKGEYFGQKAPGEKAELFAPGIMSTGLDELNAAFSPDKKEVIFSVILVPARYMEWRLVMIKEENGIWKKPEIAEFNKEYSGVDPFITADGKRIYFCSNRPRSGKGKPEDNFDIWYVDRYKSGWTAPVNIGPPINSDKDEFYPSLTKDGTMYFQSRRKGGFGESDIYFSKLINGKYSDVQILPKPINSEGAEGDAFIAPDESYIILSAARNENNIGGSDLWISYKYSDGSWSDIVNLGLRVNSVGSENCPILSPCGKYLFFTSRQSAKTSDSSIVSYDKIQQAWISPQNAPWFGDIYWIDAGFINEIKDSLSKAVDNKIIMP